MNRAIITNSALLSPGYNLAYLLKYPEITHEKASKTEAN